MTKPRLSIVSTLYRSSETVEQFVTRCASVAQNLVGDDFEIVLVDDGSPDDSLGKACALVDRMPQLVVMELSRNFGHHIALLAGLEQCRGDLVFLIDSDLEEEPEWLEGFHRQLHEVHADVVFGYQAKRKGSYFERASGEIYWRIFRALTGLSMPSNVVTCRLMTRQYVEALLKYREVEVSIGGLFALAGFRQVGMPVTKGHKGHSSYSLRLKIWHLLNSIASFSTRPLEVIFVLGLVMTVTGFGIACYLLFAALAWNQPPVGWTSVMASLWIIGGIAVLSLGVTAIYVSKIFLESKNRPRAIVKQIQSRSVTSDEGPGSSTYST